MPLIIYMRLLQLSDIHFVESTKDEKRFAPIEDCFFQDIKDQNNEINFDYILICGDIAFSGEKAEYERAELFIQRICDEIGCSKDRVLIVPGNHDLDIESNKSLKKYIRDTIVKDPDAFIKACKDSVEMKQILRALYQPFKNYYDFAKEYGCVSDFEKDILYSKDFDLNKCFSWERELKDNGGVVARLVGVNSALLSGCGNKKSKEILPEAMWMSYKKDGEHLNILMGHHPINDISNEKMNMGQIDCRFHLQISGHRHIQTTNNQQLSFKITSAAFEPEFASNSKEAERYYPVYNIIDIHRQASGYLIKDKAVAWKWNNPRFVEEDPVEFYATQFNPTSVKTRGTIKKNSSFKNAEAKTNEIRPMLEGMGYDNRRLVISNVFDKPISGATENIEIVVKNAEGAEKLNKLYEETLHKFAKSQHQIYLKRISRRHLDEKTKELVVMRPSGNRESGVLQKQPARIPFKKVVPPPPSKTSKK